MKLVIDVDDELVCEGFERNFTEEERNILIRAIGNGTPYEEPKKNCFGCQGDKDFGCEDCLNKPKGDLISRSYVLSEMTELHQVTSEENMRFEDFTEIINNAPTVADRYDEGFRDGYAQCINDKEERKENNRLFQKGDKEKGGAE